MLMTGSTIIDRSRSWMEKTIDNCSCCSTKKMRRSIVKMYRKMIAPSLVGQKISQINVGGTNFLSYNPHYLHPDDQPKNRAEKDVNTTSIRTTNQKTVRRKT